MLKLRCKVKKSSVNLSVSVPASYSTDELIARLRTLSPSLGSSEYVLSLNGRDDLADGESTLSLGEMRVVSGDLIWLVPLAPAPLAPNKSRDRHVHLIPHLETVPPTSSLEEDLVPTLRSAPSKEEDLPALRSVPSNSTLEEGLPNLQSVHQPNTLQECVALLLHTLLLGEGFAPASGRGWSPEMWSNHGNIPYKYASGGMAVTTYLSCVVMGAVCVFHGTAEDSGRVHSCQVLPGQHIKLKPSTALHQGLDRHVLLQSKSLRHSLQDQLVTRLLNDARSALGLAPVKSLHSLPVGVKLRVLSFLGAGAVLRMSSVSREWHQVAGDSLLWHSLCSRDFKQPGPRLSAGPDVDWKEVYQSQYKLYLQRKRSPIDHHDFFPLPGLQEPMPRPPVRVSYSSPLAYFFGQS